MARNKLFSHLVLYPLSRLYGIGVAVRNLMFKIGVFKKCKFDIPVVVVGNIAVGGTGKTPHTEYVVALLKTKYKVGVLSRGYKRKTSGFVLVNENSTPREVGDEPYQMYHKFNGTNENVVVAVCENRCKGIDKMREQYQDLDLIVLDDAYQHRYVDPTVSIVLTEFGRPIFFDYLLPYGKLREPIDAISRADIVVVSKCPNKLKPLEYRIFNNNLKLFHFQKLFFSHFNYRAPKALFPEVANKKPLLEYMSENDSILAIPGIANPRPFVEYLREFKPKVKVKAFPDHHEFTKKDFELIGNLYNELKGENKLIMTTEKDAVRLINNPHFPEELKNCIYFIPIEVKFEPRNSETFDETLEKLIRNSKITVGGLQRKEK